MKKNDNICGNLPKNFEKKEQPICIVHGYNDFTL